MGEDGPQDLRGLHGGQIDTEIIPLDPGNRWISVCTAGNLDLCLDRTAQKQVFTEVKNNTCTAGVRHFLPYHIIPIFPRRQTLVVPEGDIAFIKMCQVLVDQLIILVRIADEKIAAVLAQLRQGDLFAGVAGARYFQLLCIFLGHKLCHTVPSLHNGGSIFIIIS